MQLAVIEFARHVCGIKEATSREWAQPDTRRGDFVIDLMSEQRSVSQKGGTMRLGAFPCHLQPKTRIAQVYGSLVISERHRHRFEFNNKYRPLLEKKGLQCVGLFKEKDLVEIVDLPDHPWFVGVQFHPEFQSKPLHPHPLFSGFVKAALKRRELTSSFERASAHKDRPSFGTLIRG